jgi:hypothetical protein
LKLGAFASRREDFRIRVPSDSESFAKPLKFLTTASRLIVITVIPRDCFSQPVVSVGSTPIEFRGTLAQSPFAAKTLTGPELNILEKVFPPSVSIPP